MFNSIPSLRDIRHVDKALYINAHDTFYEPVYSNYEPSGELTQIVREFLPNASRAWSILVAGVWTNVIPARSSSEQHAFPGQGWKIHISATNTNCSDILRTVVPILLDSTVQFKFANDTETLRMMTSKRWQRGGSGKFVTVYPNDLEAFRLVVEQLYNALQGMEGSYILSDRRYKDSRCVYYRYGGFIAQHVFDPFGRRVEVLTSPDGSQVVDRRNPFFELPPWIEDVFPDESADLDAEEGTLYNMRFTIESAITFSNTGGVYLAYDNTTAQRVIIKEARPGVELSIIGEDAISRLAHEASILREMEGSGITPIVVCEFKDWENAYLAETFIEARDIRRLMIERSPLLKTTPSREDSVEFFAVFKLVFVSLLEAISQFHTRGIIIGDLSPTNILVDDSFSVRIIDLEGAFHASSGSTQELYTPGFRSEAKGRKRESDFPDDLYAVGVIMAYSMFPIAAMAYLRDDVFDNVMPAVINDIGWSDIPLLPLIKGLVDGSISCEVAAETLAGFPEPTGLPTPRAGNLSETPTATIVQEIGAFITRNWRSEEKYSLFPVDPYGQVSNPAGLYLGSLGIVWALTKVGIAIPPGALERFHTSLDALLPEALSQGLLTGAAGMAIGLMDLGEHERATPFLARANSFDLERSHHSLYYGLAGVGLANLAALQVFERNEHIDRAVDIAKALRRSAKSDERGHYWEDSAGPRIGFGYGQSGVALFLLRLSQVTGDPKWRDLGVKALEYDLSYGIELEAGVVSFGGEPDHRGTLLPYIEQGTGGIVKVAMRFGMWERVNDLLVDVHRKYSGFPGLIYGLTGFVDVLTDAQRYSGRPIYGEMAQKPLSGLRDLYLFRKSSGIAAPGDNLFRVSCDYGTGLAGIMYTLHRQDCLTGDSLTLDDLDDV